MCPIFKILLKIALVNLGIVFEVRGSIADMFIAEIFFVYVVKDIQMMLTVKAKKHFRVIEVAIISQLHTHRIQ